MLYRTTAHQDFKYWLFKDRIPVTKALIVANALTLILVGLFHIGIIANLLAFSSTTVILLPWTAFTYPLVWIGDPLGLLFACYWLWIAGGSLERTWGSQKFGIFFFAIAGISAAGMFLGYRLTGIPVPLYGLWLPLAGVTVAFAMMDPEQTILFFMVIPMKLKYLAILDAAMVLYSYGQQNATMGICALAGCIASYLYVRRPSSSGYRSSQQDTSERIIRIYPHKRRFPNLNPFKWYHDYKERKRLERLFKNSGIDL